MTAKCGAWRRSGGGGWMTKPVAAAVAWAGVMKLAQHDF
jgi:hypothetical protein